jgi:uncharacterized membrane protein (DUF2068 family)
LIPLELYEVWKRFALTRVAIIVVNVAIVAYLVRQLRAVRGSSGE